MTIVTELPRQAYLTDSEVAAVRAPLGEARFLPPRIYADDSFFRMEMEKVFRRTWLPVCHVSQLPGAGSYVARDMFGEAVLVTRDKDGTIRAMSNVCRHRNALLTQGSGKCRGSRISCPYHGWTYGLDGRLLAAPHMDEATDFERGSIGLPSIRHEVWQGFVFINLDDEAKPLAPQLATLEPKIAPYRFAEMEAIEVRRAKVPWNWKVSLENFSEAYHQPFIHPVTADHDFPAATAVYEDADGPYSLFWIPHRANEITHTICPPVEGMPDSYYRGFMVVNVYPLLHMFSDAASPLWLDWEIHDVDDHELVWYMMVPKDRVTDANRQQLIDDFLGFIVPILLEDVDVCKAVGRGVHSSLAGQGRLSHMEKAIHQFQNWLLDQYLHPDF